MPRVTVATVPTLGHTALQNASEVVGGQLSDGIPTESKHNPSTSNAIPTIRILSNLFNMLARYHVPRAWLKPTKNLLVVFEELGGDASKISLVKRSVASA